MTEMTPAHPLPRGAGVALLTLFDESGKLLLDATARFAAQLVDAGAASVLVSGTIGEFFLLTEDERVMLFYAIRTAVPTNVPILAHVGGTDQAGAARLTKRAVDAGADVIISLPNPDFDPRAYYGAIVEAAGTTPTFAYNLPQAGAGVALEDLPHLGVAGIKDSAGDGERLAAEALGSDLAVYTGAASLLGLAHAVGAHGALLGAANVWPELCASAMAGDATALSEVCRHGLDIVSPFPAAVKEAASQRWGVPAYSRSFQ